MRNIIQKRIIPARIQSQDEKFPQHLSMVLNLSLKSVDHVTYEDPAGQVTTFVVCAVFTLSFQAIVLLTKIAINHLFLI